MQTDLYEKERTRIMEKLELDKLAQVTGGTGIPARKKYVSAFYCENCGKTIYLNGVYDLERAKKEHNAKAHPTLGRK